MFSVCQKYENGTFFPLHLDLVDKNEAERKIRWMRIGQGPKKTYKMFTSEELKIIYEKGLLRIGVFGLSAQQEFLRIIGVNHFDMPRRHTLRVTFENNNSIRTDFNGTSEEACDYYIGKMFNLGIESDDMQRAVTIEFWDGEFWQKHKISEA